MPDPVIETLPLSDGYEAAARCWRPQASRAAVLYFHGIQSHGGWYERSGQLLADRGYTVLMPDRRGSGLNQIQRGHVASATRAVDDARDALHAMMEKTGHKSAHVIGVSWGGKLAVALASAEPKGVASLSLIAPGLFPKIDFSAAEKFRVGMALINDRDKMFDIPLNDPRFFTANPERIRFVEQDKLKLEKVSAMFLLATRRLDRVIQRFAKSAWQGPIHVMLAAHDDIIHNDLTRDWVRQLRLRERKITEYSQGRHTLEFDEDPAAFLNDLVGWIEMHRTSNE
jgi:alpha-beta hydrolase superfamily lysophospholipase